MIDFRYHVVSIVAVFLALALGLFIGSTSLRGTVASDIKRRTSAVADENRKLQSQISELQTELNHQRSFEDAVAPYAISSALAAESVVLVSAPGVDDGARRGVAKALELAGATVTGDVRMQDSLLDPQQASFLGSLAGRFALPGRVAGSGSGSQRALSLLADVLGTRPQGRPVSVTSAARVLSAYSAGKLISVSGGSVRPASLVVLLAPAPDSDADPKLLAQQQSLLLDFGRDLDRAAMGTVVAGPESAADPGGLLAAARADKSFGDSVSTVDGVDLPSGTIATVLALLEQSRGGSGSYGSASGAADPLPSPPS